MITSFFEMLQYGFIVRAFIAGIIITLCAALIGSSLVLRRQSMIGDGLSHVAFGSAAIATILGLAPLEFSIPIVAISSVFILRLGQKSKINGDAAIAVLSSSALALGTFLISINGGYEYWGSKRNGSMEYLVNNEFTTENLTSNKSVYSGYWAGIDYQHTFKSHPEKTLTFSYEMWDGVDKTNDKTIGANSLISSPYDFSGKKSDNNGRSGEHTLQLDYSSPLSKTLSMEAGAKYIIRPKSSKGDYYIFDIEGNYVHDEK